jgi:hypothetical protein
MSGMAREARARPLGRADPALYMRDPEKAKQVIRTVFHLMQRRISLLTSLPVDKLNRLALEAEARAIADKTAAGRPEIGDSL